MSKQVAILGVNVDCVDFDETLGQIQTWVETDAPPTADRGLRSTHQICTVNPEFIVDARRDPEFAQALAAADLRVPDGIGVLWAARLLGKPLRERVTGSDGIYRICERAAERGWRVFLLGAAEGVAEEAAAILEALYPGLTVAGTYSGGPKDSAWSTIKSQLNTVDVDVLFVAFGHPNQDLWIAKHRHELPAAVAIGIGGALDFVAGVLPRAPRWMQRLGIEWLYRLLLQPSRIGRMMKIPVFMGLVVKQKLTTP